MTRPSPHDVIAVGLGPFNLSLACLMQPLKDFSCLFLDRAAGFEWHPGMMLDDATLQNPFLADLVTLADPTSPFSYLNYCRDQGRLYAYFLRENFYLTRREYTRYAQWACARLRTLRFQHEVTAIEHDPASGLYCVKGREQRQAGAPAAGFSHLARKLVLGVGAAPRLPACCDAAQAAGWHSSRYLDHKPRLRACRSVSVIGSGQSAAEIFLDLLKDWPQHGYVLNWITRSSRFFQMETARLSAELLSPDYIDHFHGLPEAVKPGLLDSQKNIYNGINTRLVNEIHDRLDDLRRQPGFRAHLIAHSELRRCRLHAGGGLHELEFFQTDRQRSYLHRTEGLVFATGYHHPVPAFIEPIRHRIRWDAQGRYQQALNYAVDHQGSEIFVQNAGGHSHGMTNPDLGLTCHRNARLIRALTGVAYYPIETGAAVQGFAPPADSPWFEAAPPAVLEAQA